MLEDTYKHKGLRKKLIKEIRKKGFDDEAVLEAMGKVPRHLFLNNAFLKFAYEDKPFPIGAGQTISQPLTVAIQTSLLDIKKGQTVMEVGTGSGYQTAVLMELGAKVFTIERQKMLFDRTRIFLPQLGYKPKFHYGDGYKGLPAFAPFDKVLVTAGAPQVPQELKYQLKTGGLLLVPVGDLQSQQMILVKRLDTDDYSEEQHGSFRFVPMLDDKQWE